ncbi:MAG: LysR family transcriptional regulator [Roseovarius sp.]|nr:LysR family transcriptional regulator [Roseovarius sp.]
MEDDISKRSIFTRELVMSDNGNPYAIFARYSADLCLFLLVAEHSQLSRAAKISGLSQPRMSQRMRFLEDSLGKQLFLRERRGVALTQAGHELFNALSVPLSGAVEAFSRYQEKPARGDVVILCDIAFASFRLLPLFSSLCSTFPDFSVSLLTVQQPRYKTLPEADLIIRMEESHTPDVHEVCLSRESVSVLCSPAYKRTHPAMQGPQDLMDKTLIELTAQGSPPWFTWAS